MHIVSELCSSVHACVDVIEYKYTHPRDVANKVFQFICDADEPLTKDTIVALLMWLSMVSIT